MASKIFNVGVIGYGLSAKIYQIPFITAVKNLKLYAVVQRTPKPNDNAELDFPGIKSFRSTELMVKDPAVDVVVVTTAPDSHLELAKLALNAGKHVVVEKPFTATYQEAQELIDLAKKQNRLLTVYQSRRWDADYLTLSKLIKEGSLGRIVDYETRFERHVPDIPGSRWRTDSIPGGGAIYDLGAHLLDQTIQLFGLPKRITAFLGNQREGIDGSDDSFTVLMHYDGFMATAKAAVISPQERQLRFGLGGLKERSRRLVIPACIVCEQELILGLSQFYFDVQEEQLKSGMRPGDDGYGIEPSERYGTLTSVQPNGAFKSEAVPTVDPPLYTEFYSKLAEALAGEGEMPVSPEESAAVIRLVELAVQSSKTGRTLDVDLCP
ncbi:NAD binding Rossmann fold oxidoreductase [Aspergillus arachidicola]|uniref:NAD binding Rossmann fold oxidoreductase n=1 Tax=Aspergillus arachidicola TaxID=656916 RepID=A0A2G7FHX9_9EURO|nr:NAD binding Rossmann fold oxidoreductase [Aspergillus arachidicola]